MSSSAFTTLIAARSPVLLTRVSAVSFYPMYLKKALLFFISLASSSTAVFWHSCSPPFTPSPYHLPRLCIPASTAYVFFLPDPLPLTDFQKSAFLMFVVLTFFTCPVPLKIENMITAASSLDLSSKSFCTSELGSSWALCQLH